jgi:hypothetical protein
VVQQEGWRIIRLSTDNPDRPDRARLGKLYPEGANHNCENQHQLGKDELRPDAYAGAGAEKAYRKSGPLVKRQVIPASGDPQMW